MKQFLSFVTKEFYHIFRDTRTMMILLVMPVVQIILFGFAITTEVKNTQIAVLDPSRDVATRHIIERLNASKYFKIVKYVNSPDDILGLFREGHIGLVVVFEDHFYENLLHRGQAQVQLIADATDPNTANLVSNYAASIIGFYQHDLMKGMQTPFVINQETKFLYNPQMKGAYNFVPGVLGMILMLICAMMTSITIAREKETGTMEVLLVSPTRPIMIILAKVVPYFIISCVNLATILLLSIYVLGVPVAGSLIWLILVALLFIFVSLSLGLLVSTLTQSQSGAMLFSGMALMAPVMLLSGMMFPIESMPVALQMISNIIPAKWFIISVKNLMIKGAPITSVTKEILILAATGLFILVLSLANFKKRLE